MSERSPHYGPAARASYHHGDLRRALIDAARNLLDEGAAGGVTLRAAAQAAGVSAAAPYRHFKDREALYAAVLCDGFQDMAATLRGAREAETDPVVAYLAVGRAYLGFAAAHPRLFAGMFSADFNRVLHPALSEAARDAFDQVLQAARVLEDAGMTGQRSAEHVALAGWTMVHGLAAIQVDNLLRHVLTVDPQHAAEAMFSILVEGVALR